MDFGRVVRKWHRRHSSVQALIARVIIVSAIVVCGPMQSFAQIPRGSCTIESLPPAFIIARGLAEEDIEKGDYVSALINVSNYRKHCPEDNWAWKETGHILFLQHHYAEAAKALVTAVHYAPRDSQVHYFLMLTYRALGEAHRAAEEQRAFQSTQIP
jgi:hypothetical protein